MDVCYIMLTTNLSIEPVSISQVCTVWKSSTQQILLLVWFVGHRQSNFLQCPMPWLPANDKPVLGHWCWFQFYKTETGRTSWWFTALCLIIPHCELYCPCHDRGLRVMETQRPDPARPKCCILSVIPSLVKMTPWPLTPWPLMPWPLMPWPPTSVLQVSQPFERYTKKSACSLEMPENHHPRDQQPSFGCRCCLKFPLIKFIQVLYNILLPCFSPRNTTFSAKCLTFSPLWRLLSQAGYLQVCQRSDFACVSAVYWLAQLQLGGGKLNSSFNTVCGCWLLFGFFSLTVGNRLII